MGKFSALLTNSIRNNKPQIVFLEVSDPSGSWDVAQSLSRPTNGSVDNIPLGVLNVSVLKPVQSVVLLGQQQI